MVDAKLRPETAEIKRREMDDEFALEMVNVSGEVLHRFSFTAETFQTAWTWHCWQDMGPASWTTLPFLWHLGIRGTYSYDILHRLHNDWIQGCNNAGLGPCRFELRRALNVQRAPWKSGANQQMLLECCKLMRECKVERMPLWEYFYPDVALEMGEGEAINYGEHAHVELVFTRALEQLTRPNITDVRFMRWFSWEAKASKLWRTGVQATLFLFTFAGLQKGLWRTWEQSPLSCGGKVPKVVEEAPPVHSEETRVEEAEAPG